MTDNDDSTLRSVQDALTHVLTDSEETTDLPPETVLREQVHTLALGVAYGWTTRDPQAQQAILDELLGMPHGLGVTLAVEVFTEIRLHGLQSGSLRPGTEVTTEWVPTEDPGVRPDEAAAKEPTGPAVGRRLEPRRECVEIITDLWSGLGSWDYERVTLARARMTRLPQSQLREMLRIMAYDTYKAMERFAHWQGLGSEAVEDYRLKHPEDYEVGPAPQSDR